MRCLALALILMLAAQPAAATVVSIRTGLIEGESVAAVDRFLGIPYAQPPVGRLRWRAPQPAAPWEGVRSALKPASACMQLGNFFASDDETTFDRPYGSEDCLYLNVWAPRGGTDGRPVLVFFHGGSGIAGDSGHPLYDGARLASAIDAVVITANYRLGVWGSLQSAALHTGDPAEDSGSFFLLDMIRVLDWTRDNCAAFGCDGNRITISGQSAGAVAVLGLMRSPLAKGKFAGAISFSGLPFSATADAAAERTRVLLKGLTAAAAGAGPGVQLDTDDAVREFLYRQSADALLAASGRGLSPLYVADGTVLMQAPSAGRLHPGLVSEVPLMIGRTRDEMTTLIPIDSRDRRMSRVWPLLNGEPRDQTIRQQLGWFRSVKRDLVVAASGWLVNRRIRKVERQYAHRLPAVYAYRFEWTGYPEPWRSELGAFHALDIPFIFGNFIDDRKIYMRFAWTADNRAERERLHQEIAASIAAFVHTGSPNPAGPADRHWPAFDATEYRRIWGRSSPSG